MQMNRLTIILIAIALILCHEQSYAQKEPAQTGPFETALALSCTSTSDDSIQLKAGINVKHEEGAKFLVNGVVKFFVKSGESEQLVGEAKTNTQGIALLKVPARNTYVRSSDQLISFKAAYEGDKKFTSSEGEFSLKPAKLAVSFYEEDSVRYVKVIATQLNADGKETPLGPVDVVVSVPRMYSMLKIAGISIDSTGIGTAEFPNNIIGDSLGNLTIVAAIEENEIVGNVRGEASTTWGLHKHLISPDRPSRELWTPIAPLWMIITLIIMLAGVWGHYIYAIVQLAMISKANKKLEKS
jgi:hypothetical protein